MTQQGAQFLLNSVIAGIKPLPVRFRFIQKGVEHLPDIAMYDLKEAVGKYPIDTTLGVPHLENLGYVFPEGAPK